MTNEYLTKEEQKEIAIKRLQQLKIYKPYINSFKAKKQTVTVFENFGGFWATADNGFGELEEAIKKFEAETGSMVYAVTHEFAEFGECYSMLCVSKYREDEMQIELNQHNTVFYAFSWVWNKDNEWCSEYGTIGVQSAFGGLRRVY